jgi:hypothetical protein
MTSENWEQVEFSPLEKVILLHTKSGSFRPRRMFSVIFWGEVLVAFLLILGIFLALIYYSIDFVEERIPKIVRFTTYLSAFVLVLSLLILPAGYGKLSFFATFVTNCLWLSVLTRGFPFIPLLSPDLVLAAIGTAIAHFSWISAFIHVRISAFVAVAYYSLMVWQVPLIVTLSLSVTDEESAQRRGVRGRSVWATLLSNLIGRIRKIMPKTNTNRYD